MLRRLLLLAACLAPAAVAAPAHAGSNVSLAGALAASCPEPVAQSFLPWGDDAWYAVAPGGTFESKSGKWSLLGGAARVLSEKPFSIATGTSEYVLALPQAGDVTTPAFCATVSSPYVRFAVHLTTPTVDPSLRVEVLWRSPLTGESRSAVVARIGATSTWAPSAPIALWANLAAFGTKDGLIDLRLRLVSERGAFEIDDVMVDPYRRV